MTLLASSRLPSVALLARRHRALSPEGVGLAVFVGIAIGLVIAAVAYATSTDLNPASLAAFDRMG